eukprot:TRINITY_DN1303_c0_g1_i2.p1 TRINITY_DN1303_c0_g1~~TRINITY_DN1303_c0_g1_i2.p1  ORF type:complete len:1138 (-),score=201.50 TRINITY_DN1303_c0_g1_i2:1460-4873(-)
MRGVGSLRNITGGSGRKQSSAKSRRRNSGVGADDDDFLEPTVDFTSPIKKTPSGGLKKSKSAPQTPQGPTNPKADLRNFFRSMSAPPKTTSDGKADTSDCSKTPSKAPQPPAPSLLSPPKAQPLKASFDDAIIILDSDSDNETSAVGASRSVAVAEKENFPSTASQDDVNDNDVSIVATPSFPRAKKRSVPSNFSEPIPVDLDPPQLPEPEMPPKRKPSYYLKNFFLILDTVRQKDSHLIVPEELQFLNKIQGASDDAQRLFVRLIYRRGPWFQVSKLVYHEISDIGAAVNELIAAGIAAEPPTPVDVLHLLSTPQLKNLLKGSKVQSSLSSPTAQTPREALLDQAKKWITNQRTLFGKPVMPKELGRCIRVVESIDSIVKRIHRLFFLSQTEDQSALTLVHLGRVAFPTYLLQGVEVDDGLNGKPFPVASVVPEAFKNPYAMLLLEQKSKEETQTQIPLQPPDTITLEEHKSDSLPVNQSEDAALISTDSLGAIEASEQMQMDATNTSELNNSLPPGFRPRWLIEANLTILTKIGFCSVFPDRQTLEEYEEAMKIAVEVANLLGEDLDGNGAAGTTGELTGNMASTLTAGFGNGGSKWGRASRLSDQQIAKIISWVDHSIERVQKYGKFVTKLVNYGDGRSQVFDYEKNLFLRRYTAKWLYASVAWIGVSLLERQRNYGRAVEVLRALLATDDVCLGKRGEWWLRLGFDLAHMNELQAAIDAIVSGIKDCNIRPQQRLGLYSKLRILLRAKQRKESAKDVAEEYDDMEPLAEAEQPSRQDAEIEIADDDDDFMITGQKPSSSTNTPKISKKRKRRSSVGAPAPKRRKSDVGSESREIPLPDGVEHFSIKDPIARIIQARPLTRGSASGPSFGKSLFIGFESDTEVGVEELALQFYRLKEKFAQGSHCEGGPLGILFGLLMWDIMFDASIPHVFQTPVQDAPLDFGTEDFYNARKEAIEERLALLESHQNISDEEPSSLLADMIEQSFNKWHGRVCRVVNWTRWTLEELKDIASCIGGKGLAVIFRRFAMDFRYSHSGLPDLLLWDPPSRRAKFVEVKGPRDRLSDKQKIWIDHLMTAGIDIEVLYVREKLRDGEVDDSQDLIIEKEQDAPTQLSPADQNAKAAAPPVIDEDAMILD